MSGNLSGFFGAWKPHRHPAPGNQHYRLREEDTQVWQGGWPQWQF